MDPYITQTVQISNKIFFVYLRMGNWSLELQNRVQIGFAIGWSYYKRDEEFSYSEIILFLGLISLNFKYERYEV